MKIRNGFVSNSSSTSFVISASKDNNFHEMATYFSKSCVADSDDDDKSYVDYVYNKNIANLYCCLNDKELLFLGGLELEDFDPIYEVVVNSEAIDSLMMPLKYDSGGLLKFNLETFKKDLEKILDRAKYMSVNYIYQCNEMHSHMYEITQNTIDITRKMLEFGYKLSFSEWENLDALEKRIKDGQKLYRIHLSQGGDGFDHDVIRAFSGWNSSFDPDNKYEVIDCECC